MGVDTKRLEFPSDGFINKDTGMYQAADPKKNDSEFAETQVGSTADGKPVSLFLPVAKPLKPCRYLRFENSTQLEVDESLQECMERISKAKVQMGTSAWIMFTDPVHGTEVAVNTDALATVTAVVVGYVDLELAELQQKNNEEQKRLARMQALKRR